MLELRLHSGRAQNRLPELLAFSCNPSALTAPWIPLVHDEAMPAAQIPEFGHELKGLARTRARHETQKSLAVGLERGIDRRLALALVWSRTLEERIELEAEHCGPILEPLLQVWFEVAQAAIGTSISSPSQVDVEPIQALLSHSSVCFCVGYPGSSHIMLEGLIVQERLR
jgi:hypothetical protein